MNEQTSAPTASSPARQFILVELNGSRKVVFCLAENTKNLVIVNNPGNQTIKKKRFIKVIPNTFPVLHAYQLENPTLIQWEVFQTYINTFRIIDPLVHQNMLSDLWNQLCEMFEYPGPANTIREPGLQDPSPKNFYAVSKYIGTVWAPLSLHPTYNEVLQKFLSTLRPGTYPDKSIHIIQAYRYFLLACEALHTASQNEFEQTHLYALLLQLKKLRDIFYDEHADADMDTKVLFRNHVLVRLHHIFLDKHVEKLFRSRTFKHILDLYQVLLTQAQRYQELAPALTTCVHFFTQLATTLVEGTDTRTFVHLKETLEESSSKAEQEYHAVYQHYHTKYVQNLATSEQKICEFEDRLKVLKSTAEHWSFSPSFEYQYQLLNQELVAVRKHFLDVTNTTGHTMQQRGCGCGYTLDQPIEDQRPAISKKVSPMFTELENLMTKLSLTQGETLSESVVLVLQALLEVDGKGGRNMLKQILKGSASKLITEHNLQNNHYYGKLSSLTLGQIEECINEAISKKFVLIKYVGSHDLPFLALSPLGQTVLQKRNDNASLQELLVSKNVPRLVELYLLAQDQQKETILQALLDNGHVDILEHLTVILDGKQFDLLLTFLTTQPKLALSRIMYTIFINDRTSLTNQRKILKYLLSLYEHFPSAGIDSLLIGPEHGEHTTVPRLVELYQHTPDEEKNLLVKILLEHGLYTVIEELITVLNDKQFQHLLTGLLVLPPRLEFGILLYTRFIDDETTTNNRRKILTYLRLLATHFPASGIKPLLIGRLPVEQGLIKKELAQLVEETED